MQNRLFYKKPAKTWEEALPIGNGRLGAMIYSGTKELVLQMNEITLWNSEKYPTPDKENAYLHLPQLRQLICEQKYDRAAELLDKEFTNNGGGFDGAYSSSYQTFGELKIKFSELKGRVKNFSRSLNLENAVCSDSFSVDSVNISREYFSSAPDDTVFIYVKSDTPNTLNFNISYTLQHIEKTIITDNSYSFSGYCDGNEKHMAFAAQMRVFVTNGTCVKSKNSLKVSNADAALICFTAATDYIPDVSQNFKFGNPSEKCRKILDSINFGEYESIKKRHIEDYRKLYNTSLFEISCDNKDEIPLPDRLYEFKKNNADKALAVLMFNYGKYLLISSSRKDNVLPANLQGIWCKDYKAPWHSDYHTNINIQMNYWCAGPLNLIDCSEPLAKFICYLRENGEKTAKAYYNARGWTVYTISNPWFWTSPGWGGGWSQYPLAGAWMCKHLVEYYNFTGDKELLIRFYDTIKQNCLFNIDILFEDKNGQLMTNPATSPENRFRDDNGNEGWVCKGTAMDIEMLNENFTDMIRICEILNVDKDLHDLLKQLKSKLLPLKIGSCGQLCEWEGDWDEFDPEPHHRHVSHLYGLHPGSMISPEKTPDLANACKKTLEMRGDDGTGWSLAWKINFFARLLDGNHALKLLYRLLRPISETRFSQLMSGGGVYPNLFDAHPPFQIDGNFGAVSGMCEMLLQSHNMTDSGDFIIHLLPALPDDWATGKYENLLARGNVNVSAYWENNQLTNACVKHNIGGKVIVKGKFSVTKDGAEIKSEYLNGCTSFTAIKSEKYILLPERN